MPVILCKGVKAGVRVKRDYTFEAAFLMRYRQLMLLFYLCTIHTTQT